MKKIFITFTFTILLMCFFGMDVSATDIYSNVYGFNVDDELYDVTWEEPKVSKILYKSKQIGKTEIAIGTAIGKQKVNDETIVTYLISVKTTPLEAEYSKKVLWFTNKWKEYGFFTKTSIHANLALGGSLMNSSPKFYASDTGYSVGASGGISSDGASLGVSGSVSFVSKAIDITNNSNSSTGVVDIHIDLNKSIFRWDYERLKYAAQENVQLFSFTVRTKYSFVLIPLTVESTYETLDAKPGYWANYTGHTASDKYSEILYSRL